MQGENQYNQIVSSKIVNKIKTPTIDMAGEQITKNKQQSYSA